MSQEMGSWMDANFVEISGGLSFLSSLPRGFQCKASNGNTIAIKASVIRQKEKGLTPETQTFCRNLG